MGWHYACKKVEAEFGDGYEYHLVEVHPSLPALDEKAVPYTDNTAFVAGSISELAKWLRLAADDIEKHGCINEDDL